MQPQPFWMVKGEGPATAIHTDRISAENEAQRLARLHPNKNFFVMQAIACHRKVEVERICLLDAAEYFEEPQIPF